MLDGVRDGEHAFPGDGRSGKRVVRSPSNAWINEHLDRFGDNITPMVERPLPEGTRGRHPTPDVEKGTSALGFQRALPTFPAVTVFANPLDLGGMRLHGRRRVPSG